MKLSRYIFLLILIFFLVGCNQNTTTDIKITTEEDITDCNYHLTEAYGELIPMETIEIPYSEVLTNSNNFICPCKETEEHPLLFRDSSIKTHQIIIRFDAIYPIEYMNLKNYTGLNANPINEMSLEVSLDGVSFNRIYYKYQLNDNENQISINQSAKAIKLVIPDTDETVGILDMNFTLGEGYIIREEKELTNAFLRFNGWTGADGVFSFDLDNGGDKIGINHNTTGFIFSDTFIGGVNPDTYLRINPEIINNSFGYLDNTVSLTPDAFTFVQGGDEDNPSSVLLPNSYIGHLARNLLDSDGLTISNDPSSKLTNIDEGTMWLSDKTNNSLIIDLKSTYDLSKIYIWNYNQNPDFGVKEFKLYTSIDGEVYKYINTYQLNKASGIDLEPYTLELNLDSSLVRYIKIDILDSYDDIYVGLGKIMLFTSDNTPLFGSINAQDELHDLTKNEESARLWLQDGIVINNKIYLFPLLIKDYLTYFKVHNVGLVEMDIVNDRFDYQNAKFYSTPLMCQTDDGGLIYFGAGVMDNRDIDGFIYIYGYKDLNGRNLVVARVSEDNFLNFNEWTYYNGETWTKNINEVKGIKESVSAELSVTYINFGTNKGKYMLVVMKGTTSGEIAYALSNAPYGPFSDYETIYQTNEGSLYNGAFTYNAKMHPNLSKENKIIISYNVNTTSFSALSNAKIYYPRFISLTEIRKGEED